MENNPKTRSLSLTDADIQRLDAWRQHNAIISRSEAMRRLIFDAFNTLEATHETAN